MTIFKKLVSLAGAIAFSATLCTVSAANAVTFTYEGFTDFVKPGGGQGGTPVEGTFDNLAEVLSENESLLGVPSGSIEEIGKFNVGGLWDNGVFGSDALASFDCVGGNEPCHSFTFSFDPTAESLDGGISLSDWTLVKIAMKIGNTGGEDAAQSGHGFWLVGDGDIDGSVITFDGFSDFGADIGQTNGNSHIHFFGIQSTSDVPEPGTLAMLGIGLVGLGAMVRRRRQN